MYISYISILQITIYISAIIIEKKKRFIVDNTSFVSDEKNSHLRFVRAS